MRKPERWSDFPTGLLPGTLCNRDRQAEIATGAAATSQGVLHSGLLHGSPAMADRTLGCSNSRFVVAVLARGNVSFARSFTSHATTSQRNTLTGIQQDEACGQSISTRKLIHCLERNRCAMQETVQCGAIATCRSIAPYEISRSNIPSEQRYGSGWADTLWVTPS